LDLSTVFDLSAFVFVTEQDGVFYFNAKLYLPEENIDELEKKHGAPYRQWSKEGYITLTPGNVIDYDYIKRDILKAADEYNLIKLAYDRKFSTKIVSEITAGGVDTMPFSQNTTSFNPAITEFETLIKNNKIKFDNKIIRWMISNVALFSDLEGARKVSRKHSGKVDGVVALLMAMGQYLICQSEVDHIDLADSYKDGIFFL
jgi:phage terminase large subunit-like protein